MPPARLPKADLAAVSPAREWTFLSNHGHVLLALAQDRQARMRDVAERVGITERAVQLIVRDLEEAGYVTRRRVGRRNTYTLAQQKRFSHPLARHVHVGDLIRLAAHARGEGPADPSRT